MGRAYKRCLGAPKRKVYDLNNVEAALQSVVEKGLSIRQAAE